MFERGSCLSKQEKMRIYKQKHNLDYEIQLLTAIHCRLVFPRSWRWRESIREQDFERFPKGSDWKYDCYVSSMQLSRKYAHSQIDVYFMFLCNPEFNVMFVLYKYLCQLQTRSTLKCSVSKKLSEPGRYKDRSRKFFIRNFWIFSILLNTHRSGMFVFTQKRNRIIFVYYLLGMTWVF